MEEAAGDCTNLHIAYPSMVYGFLHLIQASNRAEAKGGNDVAIGGGGAPVDSIRRYHDAMSRIAERQDLRNDVSKYEAIALLMIRRDSGNLHDIESYPPSTSKLRFVSFFEQLYRDYDLRVYIVNYSMTVDPYITESVERFARDRKDRMIMMSNM